MRIGAYTVTKSGPAIFFYAHPAQDVEAVQESEVRAILNEAISTEPKLYKTLGPNEEFGKVIGFAEHTFYLELPSFKVIKNDDRPDDLVGNLTDKEAVLDGLRICCKNLIADMDEGGFDEASKGHSGDVEDDISGFSGIKEGAEEV